MSDHHSPVTARFRFKMNRHQGIASAFLGAAALMPAANASAQEAPMQIPAIEVEADQTPGYQPAEVSNQKLGGTPQDVAQSVTVVAQPVIVDQNATRLRDVLRNVPGITFQAGEGGVQGDVPVIRGFSGQNDIYVDGIRDSGSYRRDSFNTEAVEVVKGSSSTLFGRGSTGGTINMVSKTAKLKSVNEVTGSVDSEGSVRSTADVNKKVGDNTAVRITAMVEDSEVAGRDVVENKRLGFAPSIAVGLGTPTELTVSYLHQQEENIPDRGLPMLNGRPLDVPRDTFYGLKAYDYEDVTADIGTIRLKHSFSKTTDITNTTRYAEVSREQSTTRPQILPATPAGKVQRERTSAAERSSSVLVNQTDFKTALTTGPLKHEVITGLEMSHEKFKTRNVAVNLGALGFADRFDPDPGATGTVTRTQTGWGSTSANSVGVYGMDKIKLSDHWEVSGGLRYDYFTADTEIRNSNPPVVAQTTDRMLSTRASLSYKPEESQHYYVTYGSSFNPSAESLAANNNNIALDPEENTLYEIGGKWELLKGGLSLSSALFRIDKTNMRVYENGTSGLMALDGEQRVLGGELGVTGRITPEWDVIAGYTYLDSETVKTTTAGQRGKQLINTPTHSASLWSTYKVAPAWQVGGGAFYTGKRFGDSAEQASLNAYVTFDAMASYQVTDNVLMQLNVTNLLDEEYDMSGSTRAVEPGAGRTATLTTRVNF